MTTRERRCYPPGVDVDATTNNTDSDVDYRLDVKEDKCDLEGCEAQRKGKTIHMN